MPQPQSPQGPSKQSVPGPKPSAFLRAIGLGVLDNLKARLSCKGETQKCVEIDSAWIAFQRCAIHLLPCAFSLILISINLRGYFIGFEMAGLAGQNSQYMALLQIAAKVQELLIVASLTTVVVHRLRHDLITGAGVPFGLIGAGSLFSQASYFWSIAFVGSVSRKSVVNTVLICLVLLAGFISVMAGPAVAVLLIPRERTWSAGGSSYWINGTTDDLWPSQVGLEHYMPAIGVGRVGVDCSNEQAYTNALCPAGGYLSLMSRLSSTDDKRPWWGIPDSQYVPADLLMWSPRGQVPPYSMVSAQRGKGALESSATSIHGPSSWAVVALNQDWQDAAYALPVTSVTGGSRYRYYKTMRSKIETQLPTVRSVCSPTQPFVHGQQDLQFPVVPAFGSAAEMTDKEDPIINYFPSEPRYLRSIRLPNGTLEDSRYREFPRVSMMSLSSEQWTTSTIGVIVESPWANKTTRNITGCIVDARWARGVISVGLSQPVRPEVHSVMESIKDASKPYLNSDVFRSTAAASSAWQRIHVTDEWLKSINLPLADEVKMHKSENDSNQPKPKMTTYSPRNITTIEHLVSLSTSDSFLPQTVEHTLALVFADALARVGSWRVLDVTQKVVGKESNPSKYHNRKVRFQPQIIHGGEAYEDPSFSSSETFTKIHMKQEITGYAFQSSSVTDFLAVGVVLLHLIVAVTHTALLLIQRKSSGCWDSMPELLALTQQSTPSTVALQNTATGIERFNTFRQRAWIRESDEDARHVVLTFEADHAGSIPLKKPVKNRMYG